EANEKLFRMVIACVEALRSSPQSTTPVLRYFEVWLLRLAGLFPDLRTCAECKSTTVSEAGAYLDWEGRLRCQRCSRGSASKFSPQTQRMVRAIHQLSPVQFASEFAELPKVADEELSALTHRLIVRALDRTPRTLVSAFA